MAMTDDRDEALYWMKKYNKKGLKPVLFAVSRNDYRKAFGMRHGGDILVLPKRRKKD